MIAQAIEAVKQWIENQRKPNDESDVNGKQVVFAPNISVTGSNISKQQISDAIKMSFSEFKDFMERYENEKRRKAFT